VVWQVYNEDLARVSCMISANVVSQPQPCEPRTMLLHNSSKHWKQQGISQSPEHARGEEENEVRRR